MKTFMASPATIDRKWYVVDATDMTLGLSLIHIQMCIRDSPEIEYDKIDKTRGMDIIFVTTAKTDEEARELLLSLIHIQMCIRDRLYPPPFTDAGM